MSGPFELWERVPTAPVAYSAKRREHVRASKSVRSTASSCWQRESMSHSRGPRSREQRQATFNCSVGREDRQRKPQQTLATSMWLRCTLEQWARHSRWRLEERALDRARKAFEQPHPCQGAGGVCGPDVASVT